MLNFEEYSKYKIALQRQFEEKLSLVGESVEDLPSQNDERDKLLQKVKSDVKRCLAKIMGRYKFFGEFVYRMRYIYTYRVPTMATDGMNIFINPMFVEKQLTSDDKLIFVICHEILHNVMIHFIREKAKNVDDHEKWNRAADYEINPMLVDEGILSSSVVVNELHGLYEEKYLDKPAEEIYDLLGDSDQKDSDDFYPVEMGSIVKAKNGKYGRVDGINADGTYEITEISEQEARDALK